MRGELGAFVEKRRKELGLTKTTLAEQAGLSRQGLYKILEGDVGQTYLSTIVSLAVPLRVHPIVLMQNLLKGWEFPAMESKGALRPKDATAFVGDVTYPDNSLVMVGQVFTKTWRSQNVGKKSWEGCFLKCFDNTLKVSSAADAVPLLDSQRGLIPEQQKIAIPAVQPGETVDLSVTFTAPDYPCTAISYWKMVDQDDNIYFPLSEGLTCLVQAIDL